MSLRGNIDQAVLPPTGTAAWTVAALAKQSAFRTTLRESQPVDCACRHLLVIQLWFGKSSEDSRKHLGIQVEEVVVLLGKVQDQ